MTRRTLDDYFAAPGFQAVALLIEAGAVFAFVVFFLVKLGG